jgi:hypothetical protein
VVRAGARPRHVEQLLVLLVVFFGERRVATDFPDPASEPEDVEIDERR